jgi:hypothetical protein
MTHDYHVCMRQQVRGKVTLYKLESILQAAASDVTPKTTRHRGQVKACTGEMRVRFCQDDGASAFGTTDVYK